MRCVDCGCSLEPPRPLYCVGLGLHRDAAGRSYENQADRAAHNAAMAEFRGEVAKHPGDEVALWYRLMRIDPRERMRFFAGLPMGDDAALLRAIKR